MTSTGPDPFQFARDGGGQQDRGGTEGPAGLADAFAGMLEAYARMMQQVAGQSGADRTGDRPAIGPAAALVEAAAIASGSSLRYGQRLTEVFARHQAALSEMVPNVTTPQGTAPGDDRANAEAVRSFLREVGETALQEARRLDQDLEKLGEAVASGAAPSDPDQPHKRRWTPKP
ncbi:hypothetical protein [Jannaschia aquimarina]|uniref:Phasin protein n=1 Tax=Jannaschia aquimarina TaxID=935700 RepID=A0A0D1EE95_9RHOB|nr:hypothetical protein [Jannaschia aquimarina]KIT15226.1 hypothetical protein jaqu_30490 [Jannaschia aquimarina]SNT32643.1 hypothetical protein SAMN05421775_11177 [Jannaschia aquimarina]